jgi:acyl-ACP thioesterase
MADILRETLPVRFGSVDRSDRLTLGAAFGFFQEIAISHAEELGVGRDALAKTGQAWVLSRISVFMEKRPRYGDTVTVESWPRGSEKLFALRDYAIRDAAGAALVRGRGNWLILDIEKRRPLRAKEVMDKLPRNEGVNALSAAAPALGTGGNWENLEKKGQRRAGYSDIDYYGHVNNARYIQWVQDILDPEMLDQAEQMRLDVNYISEVLPGETVELWSCPIDGNPPPDGNAADYPPGSPASLTGGYALEGRRPDASQALFRAELRLRRGTRPEQL